MIEIENLCKSYDDGKSFVVNNVSFKVKTGEIVVLLGSSGCGKTTTLKMVNRLIEPSSGSICINGESILNYDPVTLRRSIGYVFQRIGLFPHMTVSENISIVLRLLDKSKVARKKRAYELLELVNMDPSEFADRMVSELSGGQQQRVGVARALANNPEHLLMDEPFGALDAITRDSLQEEVIKLNKELNKTIIFVTHDIFEALRLADKIIIMHEGNIEQMGSRDELIKSPKSEFVNELISAPAKQLTELQQIYSEAQS